MKVIMISGDPFILDPDSSVRRRIIEYGTLTAELHILLLSKRIKQANESSIQISDNVWVYPIMSSSRIWAITVALFTGIKLVKKIGIKKHNGVVSAQDPFELGLLGFILTRLFNLPLQLQVHNDFNNPYFIHESNAGKIRTWMARFLIPKATGIRVVTNVIKQSLISYFNAKEEKIALLPVFVDIEYISKQDKLFDLKDKYPQFKEIILMVGRFGKEKNYPLALRAFCSITEIYPDTGLIILGDGIEEDKIKKMVRELSLTKSVIFEGRQNDVASYYKGADIFLHTSSSEGYGMVFIEAAAAGLPMVSTAVGVMNDVFINNKSALINEVWDKEQVIKNILILLQNVELRKELADNAKVALSKHAYSSKESYLELYADSWRKCLTF